MNWGRIEHVLVGDQAGADAERVAEILKRLDLVYVEMEPETRCFSTPTFFIVPTRIIRTSRAGP